MRQRITYLQEPEDSIDPKLLKVAKDSISTESLKAAREERITFGFDELPQELYRVLKASHEVHVRWVSQELYYGIPPLVSRLSPGLHVFYTPQKSRNSSNLLCPLLQKAFGELDCISPEKSFTTLPTDRFSHSSELEYYSPLKSLDSLTEYIKHRLCRSNDLECVSRVAALTRASTLDLDFDTISHALVLTTFFPSKFQEIHISKQDPSSRLEVGVLSIEPPQEPEQLSLGGFLTVVGDDTKPSPTLFSFPARHHPFSPQFGSTFIQPTGLHPTLLLQISSSTPPLEDRSCALHAHLTLPRQIFADKYQLSDPLFLASKNLSQIHYITSPVDLEAPAYAMSLWGSSVLLELAPPSSSATEWTAQIPLHLRYLLPNSGKNGQAELQIPYPVLFWACTADEGSKFPINPFDRVNLGYDGLFGPRTLFYHLAPDTAEGLMNVLSVPVLDLDKSGYVEMGTAAVVLVGFLWVLWCLFGVWRAAGYGNGNGNVKSVGKEKTK